MTTDDAAHHPDDDGSDATRLKQNLARMEELSQRLVAALAGRQPARPSLQGPSPEIFAKAATAYWAEMMQNPARVIEQQAGYWGKVLGHYMEAQAMLARGKIAPPQDPGPKDRRFSNPLWDTHPYFNFIKQQYLMTARAMEEAIAGLDELDPAERKRVEYFGRQILDMLSPTNYLATNPDALERAVETEGESLVLGLENLVRDIEANKGELLVSLADREAFRVGVNIATTEGAVIYRNRLFELIQYAPRTDKVHRTPLIIFPPWINKFYILDLKPQNSLIRWIVEQGFTLFVVSWVNPDASYADVGIETYVEEGYLEAIAQVKAITGEKQVNAVGYCIAGTTLALTLALLKKRRDRSVKSATFLTTLVDFSDQGEFEVFLTDDFVDGIEEEVADKGYLASFFMSRTFSYLRANDLIYGPAIRSYMLGEPPPAFDLLYWNGDSTNLPAKMAVEYLRGLCQQNSFAGEGFTLFDTKLQLTDVSVPLSAVACETDHIAAWKSSFAGIAKMGSNDKTFILSESGHIAGIVNPPSKVKYGHYLSDAPLQDADAWKNAAVRHDGSWWPVWGKWLAGHSGAMVAARVPGTESHPVLAQAPGTYVLTRADG